MTAAAPALTTPPKQWPLFRGLVTGSFSTRELRLPPSIHTKRTTIVLNAADYCSLSSSARGELLASQSSSYPHTICQYDTHLRFFRARRAGGVVGRGATTYRRIGVCGRNGKSCFVYFELLLLLPLLLMPSTFIYFVTFIPPPTTNGVLP